MPPVGILDIDRRCHQALAQQKLIFHLPGIGVIRVVEGQRPEVAGVFQRGLHKFAVQVGQQGVAQTDHITHSGQHLGEAVVFLHPGAHRGVVAHQRGEQTELKPAQGKIRRGIGGEAAEVGTAVQETAHLDTGHHLDVGQQLGPAGIVVAQPDAAVAVAANEAGTAVKQGALARTQVGKGFPCGAGHAAAIKVVDLIVAHFLAVHLVVETGVVCRAVHQAHGTAHHAQEKLLLLNVVLLPQGGHIVQKSAQPLR